MNKDKNLHIRVTEDDLDLAKQNAAAHGLKVSEFARRLMLGVPLPEQNEQPQPDHLDDEPAL